MFKKIRRWLKQFFRRNNSILRTLPETPPATHQTVKSMNEIIQIKKNSQDFVRRNQAIIRDYSGTLELIKTVLKESMNSLLFSKKEINLFTFEVYKAIVFIYYAYIFIADQIRSLAWGNTTINEAAEKINKVNQVLDDLNEVFNIPKGNIKNLNELFREKE